MRKIFAWTVILALFAVTACSGKKTDAAQNADEGGKTAAVTENLRLRTDDMTTAEVVATLAAGTRVEILAVGREDTIDGIASNWVRVAVLGGAQDRDGNAVAAGTEGWLFGGYLSEAEDTEARQPIVSEEYAEDFDSFIKDKTYLPVEYLAALKGEDRNILLEYNPQIESNSQYDFADERDTEWYENGTFRYMQFFMPMDLFLGNSFFIKIYESQRETSGYIIKGKQTDYSKKSFKGNEPCLVDLSPLENFDADDVLRIEIDGDYITCSVANRKFSHKYFLADKETFNQVNLLLTTNACDLSKVTWPRHADGTCDYEDEGGNKKEPADALIEAAENNNAAEARRLIAAGANVNAKSNAGWTALMHAAADDSPDVARLLLAAGADVNAKNNQGMTALMYAAAIKSPDVVRLLFEAGADVSAQDNNGRTALMFTPQFNATDVARLLLAAGAHSDARDNEGKTALMYAAKDNRPDVAKLLLAAGAYINAKDNRGKTALMYATEYEYDSGEVAELLLSAGADVSAQDNNGKTALIYATDNDATAIAILLEAALMSDVEKTYVLVKSAKYGDTAEVRRFIAAGADVNAQDEIGYTALMWAARNNDTDLAELLLAAGADVNAKNNDGDTALMWAADNEATGVAELLKAAGAR